MQKKCCVCGVKKDIDKDFKKNNTTEDKVLPFCRRCEYLNRLHRYKSEDSVAERLWRELTTIHVPMQQVGASDLYFNKSLFIRWVLINKDFKHLYSKYCHNEFDLTDPLDFHIKIINKAKSVTLSNLQILLNDSGKFLPSEKSVKL